MPVAYLAPKDFVDELAHELKAFHPQIHGQLLLCEEQPPFHPAWAEHTWLSPQIIDIQSIQDGAKKLKSLSKLWAPYSFHLHRRAQLIQAELAKIKNPPLDFLGALPKNNLGAWTLLETNQILASSQTTSPFPLGAMEFAENKKTPPSRAYLKLWELFTVHGIKPQAKELVVDFGSCPGGWTWVLQTLGCQVISVDKAPLAPNIAKLKNIEFRKQNAFNLKPKDLGKIDWFFSDIICYPEKIYHFVNEWLDSGLCQNFVCTIKFQGQTDFKTTELFKKIPHSQVLHLHHNKHELTWVHSPTLIKKMDSAYA